VLSGSGVILKGLLFAPPTPAEPAPTSPATPAWPPAPAPDRSLLRLSPPDRLIAWGVVLLLLAAVASGAIGFDLNAAAPAK
jgi:hypothetical protein